MTVTRTLGAKPCLLSSFRIRRTAAFLSRLDRTNRSRTSPSLPTDRHCLCRLPPIDTTILSRRQRSLGRGLPAQVSRELQPERLDPSPDRLVRNIQATAGQEFLDVAVAEREAQTKPHGVADHVVVSPGLV